MPTRLAASATQTIFLTTRQPLMLSTKLSLLWSVSPAYRIVYRVIVSRLVRHVSQGILLRLSRVNLARLLIVQPAIILVRRAKPVSRVVSSTPPAAPAACAHMLSATAPPAP